MQITPAHNENETGIKQLLESYDLPTTDLTPGKLGSFLILQHEDELVGVIGLESYGQVGLLRSLAVRRGQRGRGYGGNLVTQIEVRARENGVNELYLLTTTAEGFFGKRGYARVTRASAPEEIQSTAEFRELCPDSAVLMRKTLA